MGAAQGMWDAAKHPRGAHGHFGLAGARRKTKTVGPRKPRGSDATRAPRIVYESVVREHGVIKKYDRARARTEFLPHRTARTYRYR